MILRRWVVEWFNPAGRGSWADELRFWTRRGAQRYAGRAVTSWRACSAWRIRDRKGKGRTVVVARTSDSCWQTREYMGWPKARETE